MFRLYVWDTHAHEVVEVSELVSALPLNFMSKWRDGRYHIYMARITIFASHRWSYWLRPAAEWREYAEDQVPKMVRMAAMLLG